MGSTDALMDDLVTLTRSTGQVVVLTPMGTNALCAFEERTGLTFGALMAALGITDSEGSIPRTWSLLITRQFLQACAPEGASVEAMGTLIDDIGFEGIGAAVNRLIAPARTRG